MNDLQLIDAAGEALARLWPHGHVWLHINRYRETPSFDVTVWRSGVNSNGTGSTPTEAFGRASTESERSFAEKNAKRIEQLRSELARLEQAA